jgi:EF-P beta-lysylation protein EpmB
MIPGSAISRQMPNWRRALAEAITDPIELLAALGLGAELAPAARAAARFFPLKVPRGYVARMRRGDPNDPLLRQVLPLGVELEDHTGFDTDPVGDRAATVGNGLLRKYQGRSLLIATGACAVHCRYCFRRHYPYVRENASAGGFASAIKRIAADASLREVILSGGDPLTLSDRRLGEFAGQLSAVSHVARLRIHTRLPVVLPERVDDALLAWLAGTRTAKVVVIHANHANEIDGAVRAACVRLRGAGATLLNQSVLLRGVNDDARALAELSEALFEAGVLPYYLHLLDRVRGAAHFEVPESEARGLYQVLRARLPGYLVPRLVREEPGAPAKLPVV